jgi:hypothetical protein
VVAKYGVGRGAGSLIFLGVPTAVVYGGTFGWDRRPFPLILVLRLG